MGTLPDTITGKPMNVPPLTVMPGYCKVPSGDSNPPRYIAERGFITQTALVSGMFAETKPDINVCMSLVTFATVLPVELCTGRPLVIDAGRIVPDAATVGSMNC